MRRLALCLALLGAVSTGYGLQAAPAPSPPSSSGVAPEAGGDAEAAGGDGGECKAALQEALSAAVGQPHGLSHGELFDSIRLSSIAAARCRDSPLALGTALAKRAGSLFELGDAVQAVHNSWAALGATGALNFTHQTLASHMAATSDAVDAAGRLGRMQELSWMARELFNLGQQLTIIGQHDIGREALATSQDFSLQRWALQSDLHALRRVVKQPELDPAEAARRAVDPATRAARAQSNPVFMLHGEQASGPQSEHRTWQGEGRGTPVSRFAPPPRSLVRDVQAVAAAQGGDGVAWDADEGLVSVTAFSRAQWGHGYGHELDQLVLPPLSPDLTTSAAKAVTGRGPLPAAADEVPAAWQWGATADSTSARYWEPEMFVAEFENVFVEGPSGVVYDNYRVYLNSHLEQVPLAKDFVGDAGTGAGTARPRELVRVATGVSLVQYKHNNYYHFVAEVLPRLFLALQHVTGGNTRSRHTPPSMLSRPKYIVPMGPPFIGGFIDLMGIGVEDMVVYHPDHTVVHADQLFVGDWRASVKRAPAPPLGVAASNHSHLPSIGASSVGANGEPSVVGAFPVELARRALDPSSIQHADPWLLGAGAERARQGDTTEYTHATMHHALARQAQQGRSEDDMRAVHDKRDITHLPPRTLLQQIRKHFAKVLLSPPPEKFAVDTASELAVLDASAPDAATSHGSSKKKVKKRKGKVKRKVKRKVRKTKGSKQASASRSDKPGDAPHQTYAGFSSPFLWSNGSVLAYPPIKTVLLLQRKPGFPRRFHDPDGVLETVAAYFSAAAEAQHGETASMTVVREATAAAVSELNAALASNSAHEELFETAKSGGVLHLRSWLQQQHEESLNRTLANEMASAAALKDLDAGGEVVFSAVPAVAQHITLVQLDPSNVDLPAALKLFQQADVVIGAHGAALANVLFSPPSTSVVEFALQEGAFRQFAHLCAALGLDYWAVTPPVDAPSELAPQSKHAAGEVQRDPHTPPEAHELWDLLLDDPAPVRPVAYEDETHMSTTQLEQALAAVISSRARKNQQAQDVAFEARRELVLRGLLG